MTSSVTPGWYPDGSGGTRYWNGSSWTDAYTPPPPPQPTSYDLPAYAPPPPPPPPGPAPAGRPRNTAAMVVLGILALAGIIAVAAALAGGSHHAPAASSSTSVSISAPASTPDLPSSANVSSNAAAADLTAWFSGVSDDLDSVQKDEGDIATAAGNQDVSSLQEACASLKQHVVTFEADPASPDAEVRSDLARAMDDYSTSASSCLGGDYTAAADQMNQGTTYINAATTRIAEINAGH